jgi:uncharacterized protein YjbI with pentapeptide repeats
MCTIAVLAAFSIWSILFLPQFLVDVRHMKLAPAGQLNAEAAIRSAIIQVIGGAVVIVGLYFTARGFRLTREGHITDRYAKAIGQIGDASLDVRIGGIFALERIMRDSQGDRSTIVEILTAFIREHTRDEPRKPKTRKVTADVQAALTVIGRRPEIEAKDRHLDLYHCGLNDANLAGTDLRNAMIYYSVLINTSFASANLDGAGLSFCSAKRAAFSHASAKNAHFVNASYTNGWFLEANLTDADFYGCDLSGSDFGRRYAEEGNPPIPPANLTNVRMTRAKLDKTNLRGVDLSTVRGLQPEQLAEAITDKNTVMPLKWGGGEDEYS